MKLINIHTHQRTDQSAIELVNHQVQHVWHPAPENYYSVGFHPWDIEKNDVSDMLQKVEELASSKQVLAIGECGIDRAISTPISQQENVFKTQVELAEATQKPLIIHSVKSYSDLLKIKKESPSTVPWILHGYQGNAETTKQLLKHDFHFSFGAILLQNSTKIRQALSLIPLDHLFLETDTSSEKLETIYIFAANLLRIDLLELKKQLYNNFKRLIKE